MHTMIFFFFNFEQVGMWKWMNQVSLNFQMAMSSQCSSRMVIVRVLENTAESDSSPHHNKILLHIHRQELITYLMILSLTPYCSSEFLPDQVSYLYEDRKLSN